MKPPAIMSSGDAWTDCCIPKDTRRRGSTVYKLRDMSFEKTACSFKATLLPGYTCGPVPNTETKGNTKASTEGANAKAGATEGAGKAAPAQKKEEPQQPSRYSCLPGQTCFAGECCAFGSSCDTCPYGDAINNDECVGKGNRKCNPDPGASQNASGVP